QGNNAPGILASAPGDVTIDVTIDSIGNIITDGVGSPAILAISGIGQTTVYNQANLSTYGSNADGVAARGPAGATVINSGEIGVRGANSDALYARTIVRGFRHGKASVVNDGALSTFAGGSRGIVVDSVGDAEVTNGGDITIGAGQSEGIFMSVYGHAVVHNSGHI